jgi:mRNA interferase RelE/StbE
VAGYTLLYKQQAVKDIQKLPVPVQKRLKKKLEWFIAQQHPLEFATRLTKPADAQYRFRVGSYRILFDVDGQAIIILHVQHRRDVYSKR